MTKTKKKICLIYDPESISTKRNNAWNKVDYYYIDKKIFLKKKKKLNFKKINLNNACTLPAPVRPTTPTFSRPFNDADKPVNTGGNSGRYRITTSLNSICFFYIKKIKQNTMFHNNNKFTAPFFGQSSFGRLSLIIGSASGSICV